MEPLSVSLLLAACTCLCLLPIGLLGAWQIVRLNPVARILPEILCNLPLALPPTVLGFYLLLLLSPTAPFGKFIEHYLGIRLVFSFWGMLCGSLLYSLPFMLNPLINAFAAVPSSWIESARLLGASSFRCFYSITLPACLPQVLSALMITFAHTLGEFGIVLMTGGNIPGKTRTLSVAIYTEAEAMNLEQAATYSIEILLIACLLLLLPALLKLPKLSFFVRLR